MPPIPCCKFDTPDLYSTLLTDPHSPPNASLQGGLSKNGQWAELIIIRNGQPWSMMTDQPWDYATSAGSPAASPAAAKRVIDLESGEEAANEDVLRSMARRKKHEPPMDINQKCSRCDKVFKRPCDLT